MNHLPHLLLDPGFQRWIVVFSVLVLLVSLPLGVLMRLRSAIAASVVASLAFVSVYLVMFAPELRVWLNKPDQPGTYSGSDVFLLIVLGISAVAALNIVAITMRK